MTTSVVTTPDQAPPPGTGRPEAAGRAPGPWTRHPLALACLLGAAGVLVHATAYAVGWSGRSGPALAMYYLGVVVLVVPFAILLTSAGVPSRARLAGSVVYGLLLHVSWLLSSAVMATRFDETLHVTTLLRMLEDGFFAENAMLPVSPHYPGLELAAAGLVWLTGAPLMAAQVLVVLSARAVLVVALFALGTRIGGSSRVGSTVVLLYSASTHFYFFNAMFSYQTVAVAMLVASFVLLLQAADSRGRRTWVLLGATQATLAALTISHHLTSWLALAALWVVAGLLWLGGETRRARLTLLTAEAATAFAALWTTVVAPLLLRYLVPLAQDAGVEVSRLLSMDDTGSRSVLESGGNPTPLWQVAVMAGAILLWCVLLVPALLGAVRGTTMRRSSARLAIVALAAAYPAMYAVRFFPRAAEVADRASTFVTMAAALLVALWIVPRLSRFRDLVAPGAVLLVLGGILLGGGQDWQRVPGPYLPGAEQRSVDGTTVAFARWAGRYLPEGSRVASDLTLNRVLPNFAPVVPVTQQSGGENLTPVFVAPVVDDEVVAMLQENAVDFVIVDTRIIDEPVLSAAYYESGGDFGPTADRPTRQMLQKFDGAPGFEKVLDGPIAVYDVRSLRGQPAGFTDRPDPGLPGDVEPVRLALAGALLLGLVLLRGRDWARSAVDAAGRRLVLVAVLLPGAMLLGGLGVLTGLATGGQSWTGSIVMAGLVLLGALAPTGGTRPPSEPSAVRRSPVVAASASASVALVALAVAVSVWASWRALADEPLPEPPGPVPAAGPQAVAGETP